MSNGIPSFEEDVSVRREFDPKWMDTADKNRKVNGPAYMRQ
jgi:hypothetical protein